MRSVSRVLRAECGPWPAGSGRRLMPYLSLMPLKLSRSANATLNAICAGGMLELARQDWSNRRGCNTGHGIGRVSSSALRACWRFRPRRKVLISAARPDCAASALRAPVRGSVRMLIGQQSSRICLVWEHRAIVPSTCPKATLSIARPRRRTGPSRRTGAPRDSQKQVGPVRQRTQRSKICSGSVVACRSM